MHRIVAFASALLVAALCVAPRVARAEPNGICTTSTTTPTNATPFLVLCNTNRQIQDTIEPTDPTYSFASVNIANAGAGVIFELTGAASHVIRIRSCSFMGVAPTATYDSVLAEVLSTADSGGTAGTAPTVGPFDSNNATTAATAVAYTTSPTAGTVQSVPFVQYAILESSTVGTQPPQAVLMDFANIENSQPPTLRSASQQFVLRTGAAVTGAVFYASCKFTDTPT